MFAKAASRVAVAIACVPVALLSGIPARAQSQTLPNGQTITPTAARGSVQQFLNPGLAAYPNFVAGEAVRSRLSPDGTTLAMVTLDAGNYRIAVQDLATGAVRVLSHGHLDESPSFAPNGATLIYSQREASRGTLATISVDGLTGLRLKAQQAAVGEPAWGPFGT